MFGETPLHLCSKYGFNEIAKIIIQKNASLNKQCNTHHAPIHIAILNKRAKMVKILCDSGADLELQSFCGKNALEFANANGNSEIVEIITKMLDKNSNLTNKDKAKRIKFDDCIICCNPRYEIFVMIPCGHAKTCKTCCERVLNTPGTESKCPVCRMAVTSLHKVFH